MIYVRTEINGLNFSRYTYLPLATYRRAVTRCIPEVKTRTHISLDRAERELLPTGNFVYLGPQNPDEHPVKAGPPEISVDSTGRLADLGRQLA